MEWEDSVSVDGSVLTVRFLDTAESVLCTVGCVLDTAEGVVGTIQTVLGTVERVLRVCRTRWIVFRTRLREGGACWW